MNFNSIIGQDIITVSLRNAVKNNTIVNGYILSGPRGCGKTLTACVFAMALNCSNRIEGNPCGVCSSCIRTENGSHPNVDIVKPTGATIKIKQIRDIINEVAKKPFESGYKVVILEDAEKMTFDAQDAFLKTLEEPPANTVFILLTENYNSILPTIQSRCQLYQFKPLDIKTIEEYLRNRHVYSEENITIAARHSRGVIGRALELLENKDLLRVRDTYIEILDEVLTGHCSSALRLASETINSKEEADNFLSFSLEWFRDIAIFNEAKDGLKRLFLNIDRTADMAKHNSILTEGQLNSIMEIIKNTLKQTRYNIGIKNTIDGMLLKIAEVSLYNGKNGWSKV